MIGFLEAQMFGFPEETDQLCLKVNLSLVLCNSLSAQVDPDACLSVPVQEIQAVVDLGGLIQTTNEAMVG